MSDEAKRPVPGENDPRLRAFLRKAGGIIAAERGLNARSRMLLQALAEQNGLPQELFDIAIQRLQDSESLSEDNLSRWEKAFISFLDKELEKLPRGILTVSMESRAIDLARRKYQISEIRAQRLIQQRAEFLGIGRIPLKEARRYVSQAIADRIGDQSSLDVELRNQLYETGRRWGIDRGQVDAIITQALSSHLARGKGRWAWPVTGLVLILIFIGALIATGQLNWLTLRQRGTPDQTVAEPGDLEQPAIRAQTGACWKPEVEVVLQGLVGDDPELVRLLNATNTLQPMQRAAGFKSMLRRACNPSQPISDSLNRAFSTIYYAESSQEIIDEVHEELRNLLVDPADSLPPTLTQLKSSYRANRLLSSMGYHAGPEGPGGDFRVAGLASLIQELTGLDITQLEPGEYLKQSDGRIALDQWNQLLLTGWAAPARAASTIGPLYELTRSRLDRPLLNQFRHRLIVSTLELDMSQWQPLRKSIESAIQVSDEVKLHQWMLLFEKARDPEFEDFLAPLLVRQAEIQLTSFSRDEVAKAIREFRLSYLNSVFAALIERDQIAQERTADAVQSAQLAARRDNPNSIASLATLVNANLTLMSSFLNRSENHSRFDEMIQKPRPVLAELVVLPIDSQSELNRQVATPTASENREKASSIARLRDLRPDQTASRITAFARLAEVAARFRDISYEEAGVVAEYLLDDLDTAQWLNVENNLPALRHWHQVALAVSDRLPDSEAGLDQAISLVAILCKDPFAARNKLELQRHLFEQTLKRISRILGQAPGGKRLDWNRLRVFLLEQYRLRVQLVTGHSVSDPAGQELTTLMSKAIIRIAEPELPDSEVDRLKKAIQLVDSENQVELPRVVALNQLLVETWTQVLERRWPRQQARFRQLFEEYRQLASQNVNLGRRLFATELAMLKLSSLARRLELDRILEAN